MTELMKRYLKETGESIQIRGTLMGRNYVAWLETKVLDEKTIEKFQKIICSQCDEISALKAQLTWRLVSEKPKKGEFIVIKYANGHIPSVLLYGGSTPWESIVELYGISGWFSIPPALEGE